MKSLNNPIFETYDRYLAQNILVGIPQNTKFSFKDVDGASKAEYALKPLKSKICKLFSEDCHITINDQTILINLSHDGKTSYVTLDENGVLTVSDFTGNDEKPLTTILQVNKEEFLTQKQWCFNYVQYTPYMNLAAQ